jgi:hypothetical protein
MGGRKWKWTRVRWERPSGFLLIERKWRPAVGSDPTDRNHRARCSPGERERGARFPAHAQVAAWARERWRAREWAAAGAARPKWIVHSNELSFHFHFYFFPEAIIHVFWWIWFILMQIFCVILSNDNFCLVKYYKVLLENRIMRILQMFPLRNYIC